MIFILATHDMFRIGTVSVGSVQAPVLRSLQSKFVPGDTVLVTNTHTSPPVFLVHCFPIALINLLAYYTPLQLFHCLSQRQIRISNTGAGLFICFVHGCFPCKPVITSVGHYLLFGILVFLTRLPFPSYHISYSLTHTILATWRGFIERRALWFLPLTASSHRMFFHQLPPCSFLTYFRSFVPKTARSSSVLFKS